MNTEIKKLLKDAFKKTKLTVRFGDGWVNIANPKGTHCEFYPCYDRKDLPEEILSARYTVDGVECDLDYQLPLQISDFVEVCQKILKEGVK